MKQITKKYNICKSCLCLRCQSLLCPYEKNFNCYPTNAGCVRCMMIESDTPVTECEFFNSRSRVKVYKVKAARKNPYYRIATLLQMLHNEYKNLQ